MPEVDPVYSVEDFFDSIAKYLSPEQRASMKPASARGSNGNSRRM